MAEKGATPSHQFFSGFNAFFSPTWKKTRVEQLSRKVLHLWCILGHPNEDITSVHICSIFFEQVVAKWSNQISRVSCGIAKISH